jgi:O-antigen ligase
MFFGIFIFCKALHLKNSGKKAVLSVLSGFAIGCILVSYSRASWLAAIVSVVLLLFVARLDVFRFVIPSAAVLVLLIGTVSSGDREYAAKRLMTAETIAPRGIISNARLKMFMEQPVFGWGYDTYSQHRASFIRDVGSMKAREWERNQASSHNTYLTVLSETGMVGFCLYYFPLFALALTSLRAIIRRKTDGPAGPHCLKPTWIIVVFFLTVNMFIDTAFFPFFQGTFWFCLGVIHVQLNVAGLPGIVPRHKTKTKI